MSSSKRSWLIAFFAIASSALPTEEASAQLQFSAPTIYPAGNGPGSSDVGDFNGDGNQDLVFANAWGGYVTVFLGNGDGTYQPAASVVVGSAHTDYITVGDFNGDGKLD